MMTYLGQRIVRLILQVLLVLALVFVLFRLVPGNPILLLTGGTATQQQIHQLSVQMGWNQPLWIQLIHYVSQVFRFRLGTSLLYNQPVSAVIAVHLPPTLALTGASMLIAIIIGVPSGIITAIYPRSISTKGIDVAWILLLAIPNFWLALLLVQVFAVRLHWLPVLGYGSSLALILPAVGIGARLIALISQVTRASINEVFTQPFIQVAQSKGLSRTRLLFKHTLKPAALPILTMIGLQTGYLLGGSVVIENVFSYPGVGQLLLSAIDMHDYALIEGLALTFVTLFLIVNLLVDLAYAWMDPRIHYV